jgi:hypothetical protein
MCHHLKIGGQHVIVCGDRRPIGFCICGREALFLCDWKVWEKKSGTCDAPICGRHAKEVAPEKHLCPQHQRRYDQWKYKHPQQAVVAESGVQQSLFSEAKI